MKLLEESLCEGAAVEKNQIYSVCAKCGWLSKIDPVLLLLCVHQHWHLLVYEASPQYSDRKGGHKSAFMGLNLGPPGLGPTAVGGNREHLKGWPHSGWVSVFTRWSLGQVFKVSIRRKVSNDSICISSCCAFMYGTKEAACDPGSCRDVMPETCKDVLKVLPTPMLHICV